MILDLLFGKRSSSLENPNTPMTGQNLQDLIFGDDHVSLNYNNAMGLSAVYSCIYVLSSSLAQLPLGVFRKEGNKIEAAKDHPAYYLLHNAPNYWQTSYKWREILMSNTVGWGNGYSKIHRNPRGEIVEIEYLKASETSLNKLGGRWFYSSLSDGEKPLAISPEDMIHTRALGSDGKTGISLIKQHAATLKLGLAVQKYGNDFFASGGKPTGLVSVKSSLNDESWGRLKTVWQQAITKLKGSESKTLLLPAELDYKALSIPPEDAQFIETRKFNRSEIAGIFNMPAHMINDLDKATFSNISEQSIQFVRHTVMPWVVNFEQEFNRKLFTEKERKAGYYVKFNIGALLRGTPTERAQYYHYALTDTWMNPNEVRMLEDLNPVDGLDDFLLSVNAAKLTEAKKKDQAPVE